MINLDKLKEQNKLTIRNSKIAVIPTNKYDFITYPIPDETNCLFLTLEEYLGLRANYYCFTDRLDGLEIRQLESE